MFIALYSMLNYFQLLCFSISNLTKLKKHVFAILLSCVSSLGDNTKSKVKEREDRLQ